MRHLLTCLCLIACHASLPHFEAMAAEAAHASFLVSPDGQHLAYGVPAYDEEGGKTTRLMVCGLDGADKREVGTLIGWVGEVMWLGKDRLLCMASDTRFYWSYALAGGPPQRVLLPRGCVPMERRLSPDGARMAFTGRYAPPTCGGQCGLFVVDLAANEVRQLIDAPLKTAPAWSPDSKKLAIGNADGFARDHKLVIVDVETGEITSTGITGAGAAWSPDGEHIALTTETLPNGTWQGGVPTEGRLSVLELASMALIPAGPRPRSLELDKPGGIELGGCVAPLWSPNGEWIAYRRTTARQPSAAEQMQRTDSIWIVRKDGRDSRKVLDGRPRIAWGPASDCLYALRERDVARESEAKQEARADEIIRIDTGSLEVTTVAQWDEPTMPELPKAERSRIERPGVVVEHFGVDEEVVEAYVKLMVETRREFEEGLGLELPDTIELVVEFDPANRTKGPRRTATRCVVSARTRESLAPSAHGGYNSVVFVPQYFARLGPRLATEAGLPEKLNSGWRAYVGCVVTDAIAKRLGDEFWPYRHDISSLQGLGLLKDLMEGADWRELAPLWRAARMFWELDKRYGRDKVGRAMNQALAGKPTGMQLMPRFLEALRELTGDADAGDWIPQELLDPAWPPIHHYERAHTDGKEDEYFFADQKVVPDETGVTLRYDDGTAEGATSPASAWLGRSPSPVILFRKPEGKWAIDRISFLGHRWVSKEMPKSDFCIYICDERFVPIAAIDRPHDILTARGEPAWNKEGAPAESRWCEIPIDPVEVPERFYICLSFRSGWMGQGVTVAYDRSGGSHSREGHPLTGLKDVGGGGYDWMIRVHLTQDLSRIASEPTPVLAVAQKPWQRPGERPGEEIVGPDGGTLVWVPPGTFMMGSDRGDQGHEGPVHEVRLTKGFWMGKYEVTNGQFRKVEPDHDGGDLKGYSLNEDDQPAGVTWDQAMKYCEHFGLALPTEAEWEYAARAGTDTPYYWGDSQDDAWKYANVADLSAKKVLEWDWGIKGDDGHAVTAPGGCYEPNAFGLHDMIGNLCEYCQDWLYLYSPEPQTDPTGPVNGEFKVSRGSCYDSLVPVSYRQGIPPGFRMKGFYGFRVVARP